MKLRYEPALSPLWFALSLVAACDSVRLPRFGEHPKEFILLEFHQTDNEDLYQSHSREPRAAACIPRATGATPC